MALTTVKSDQIQSSVALAGSPTTTTQSASDNSTKIATTAYVETAVANLVASAPSALNTLDELAAALNDDASFSTTVTNSIATKLPLAGGTLTGDSAITKETPVFTLTDSSASRTLQLIVDDNNSVVRASGPLLLQSGGASSAITLDASQNATFGGTIATGGITINGAGSTISDSSDLGLTSGGTLTVDVAGQIILDADSGGDILLKDGGTNYGKFSILNGDWVLTQPTANKDILFKGNDGNAITALTLDMSASGAATFNSTITSKTINITGDNDDLIISSADYQNVFIGNRGASGADLDKGYFRLKSEGTDTVVIDTAGVSYFNGGDVGIGVSPTTGLGLPLQIQATTGYGGLRINGTGNYAQIWDLYASGTGGGSTNKFFGIYDRNASKYSMVVEQSTGYVGIGTQTPDNALHIKGSGFNAAHIKVERTDAGSSNDAALVLKAAAGANNSYGLGGIWFQNALDSNAYTLIRGRTDDSSGTSGRLEFITSTSAVGNATTPKMVIKSNGYVGIGTQTPGALLDLETAGNTVDGTYFSTITINNTGSSTYSRLRFDRSGSARWGVGLRNDDNFHISKLWNVASDNTFTIDSTGRVGINTNSPYSNTKLTVNGGIRFNTTPWSTGDAFNVIAANTYTNYNVANVITSVYYKAFLLTIYSSAGYSQSLFLANAGSGVGFGFTVLRSDSATPHHGSLGSGITLDIVGNGNEEFQVVITYGGGSLSVKRVAADNQSSSWGVFVHVLSG